MLSLDSAKSSIAKAITYGSAVQSAVGLLPGMIQSAETLLPVKGSGAQKLEMVKNWVQGALAFEGHAAEVIEAIWPRVEPVIATLVTLYTGNGAFAAILGAIPVPAAPAPATA
jgi:hypothetical protein